MSANLQRHALKRSIYDIDIENAGIRHNVWVDACNSHSVVAYFYNLEDNDDIVLFPRNARDANYGYDILEFLKKVTRFQARSGRYVDHCDDGPAIICFNKQGRLSKVKWAIGGRDITGEANDWVTEMGIPPFYHWNDGHKALFKLRFGGVT